MIGFYDVETYEGNKPILDARKFKIGCLILNNRRKAEFYEKKEELWNRIIQIGKAERKRNKNFLLYAHNAIYDFHSIANLKDTNIKFFCYPRPFIVDYIIKNRTAIKFLDTMSIFKGSLKELGEKVGLPKLELPNEENGHNLRTYLERDVRIMQKGMEWLKSRLEKEEIKTKQIITRNQLAINYLMKKWENYEHVTYKHKTKANKGLTKVHKTIREKEIHKAYRGGRVQAFQTGWFEKVGYIDVNSLYPEASVSIRFPDLRSERKIWNPLDFLTRKELFSKIGISKAIVYNHKDKLGMLPVRTGTGNYYPTENKYLIGTWTHHELKHAEKEGYKIIKIEWSVIWNQEENPWKKITPHLYKRKQETEGIERYFYKQMMNGSYGKLGQTNKRREYTIDSIEKAEEYLKKNYEILDSEGYNYIYKAPEKEQKFRKRYYAPILPTLINAWSRVKMYYELKKVPLKDLLYTDTDSIVYKGYYAHKFTITNRLGDFKIEEENTEALIYGRKTLMIGPQIKIAGIKRKNVNEMDFKRGVVKDQKMITLLTGSPQKAGSFTTEERDLSQQRIEHDKTEELLKRERIFVDNKEDDIRVFIPILKTLKY